jgi:hypothetical protein
MSLESRQLAMESAGPAGLLAVNVMMSRRTGFAHDCHDVGRGASSKVPGVRYFFASRCAGGDGTEGARPGADKERI